MNLKTKIQPEKKPCSVHELKGYKKGCKDCFAINRPDERDDSWHLTWERDNFGDN